MSQQLLYVAIGPAYLKMALRSAASAIAAGFGGAVTIVTDSAGAAGLPVLPPGATLTSVASVPNAREYKTRFLDFASADQVLYLDCDTVVTGSLAAVFVSTGVAMVRELWAAANSPSCPFQAGANAADFVLCVAAGCQADPLWNSGVIAIANDAPGKALCAAWHAEWLRSGKADELALLRALKSRNVTPATLDRTWNDMAFPPKSGLIQHWVGGQSLLKEYANG
ncbi:MAG: hypothetical protein ABSG68_05415 [Thermoguttaceae bacterium]